jgi:hypothetical protein
MTRWFGYFHGGSSYAMFSVDCDEPEEFSSLREARHVFQSRSDFDPCFPCVDEGATMWLFKEDPRETGGDYPDRVFTIGPRGGVRGG